MTHPAIPLITAGRVTEAIAYLTALRDPRYQPGINLLAGGYEPEAIACINAAPGYAVIEEVGR